MMKRITILIFLCLLLLSSLSVTAMADSIDTPNELLVEKLPAYGHYVQSAHTKITPNKLLRQRASGCASCEDEGDSED
jgi:hypothetical protein